MSFKAHIKQICKTAFFHLRNISKIRNILSQSDAEKLVHPSANPNAAARVLTGTRKREQISPVLASLHWLPVKSRIEFKILLLTYKVLNNQAPSYLNDLVHSVTLSRKKYLKNVTLMQSRKYPKESGSNSFLSGTFHLYIHDRIFVTVSNTSKIIQNNNYFGAFML
uniref:THD domain-containing protein n=1 Tax=Maylandia zebra TaxID=106582 RepID=A0A3P9DJ14_9CICH